MRKLILGITGGVSFLVFLVLAAVSGHMISGLTDQQMAKRWSEEGGVAQISCFFSVNARVTEDTLQEFEHSLDSFLQESSITQESENAGARLWADAYSAEGRITLTGETGRVEADALGVGGDFFLFHPQQLLYGAYFSGNDLNSDYCVIDQDAAWQLFGSNNAAGMTVYIAGVPHIVSGVIERPQGKLMEKAGLDGTRVYVSMRTLETYGSSQGINHYEIVMPNPVKEFALKHVKEQLGSDEMETEVIENSTRFRLLNRLKVIGAFGTRSMNGRAIIYPYWENVARGYEDMIGLITVFMLIFLLYPVILALVFFILWWRHKGWTFKDVWHKLKDKLERLQEKRYYRRQNKRKEHPKELPDELL
ncbi:MAG: ABC transporter permease [Muribaculum sp.]|nr:ABC transporter permease [Muribaculum sp.]